jgi:hypothetical protein
VVPQVLTAEGDGFYHAGKYELALSCYEKEIEGLRLEAYRNGKTVRPSPSGAPPLEVTKWEVFYPLTG